MESGFRWAWHADESGEHVRVVLRYDGQPAETEVCRLVPGRTDDRTGCVPRAKIVCDALTHFQGSRGRAEAAGGDSV